MIRLRALIEAGLRHRWLGPLVVLLLAVLLLGVAFHEGAEKALDAGSGLCIAVALALLTALFCRPLALRAVAIAFERRGPPAGLVTRPSATAARTVAAAPLRL